MPDLSSYSGVPSQGVQYGTPVQTGTAGTSNSSDYSVPVFIRGSDGQWHQLPAGTPIPGGATVSLATAPAASTPAGSVVTGSGIIDQAETNRHNVATETTAAANAAAQATANQNTATYQQGSLAIQGQQAQNQAAAQANQHAEAMAQYALQGAQAQAQYALDFAKYGETVAQNNFNQKVAVAQQQLQEAQYKISSANFGLSQNQFNASQRQAQEAAREHITEMLASRKGPQDYVAYNNLLNGLSAPTPTSTTTSDPYAGLADLYKESNIAMPEYAGGGLTASPSTPAVLPPYPSTAPAAGATPGAPAPGSNFTPAGAQGTGITHAAPAGSNPSFTSPGAGGQVATPVTPAPSPGMSGTNINGIAGQQTLFTPVGTNPGNVAANGQGSQIMPDGTVRSSQSRLGGGSSGAATGDFTADLQASRTAGLPGLAGGGTVSGAAIVGEGPGKPSTAEIKNDPHSEIAYSSINPDTGNAETHVIPHDRAAQILDMISGRSGGRVHAMNKLPKDFAALLPRAAEGGVFGGGDKMFGGSEEELGQQQQAQQLPALQGGTGITAVAPPQISSAFDAGSTPVSESAQSAQGAAPLAGSGQYNAGLDKPVNVYNAYNPADLGANLPAYQKLIGSMGARPYGGFGAQVGSAKLGISNAPTAFNLRNYNLLNSSEQKQNESLYSQGLGMDWEDLMNQARTAAPTDPGNGPYRRIMAPAVYGG